MKKLLILGGSYSQLPMIQRACEMGLYVITCDNKPANPGHAFAHEYQNISIVDGGAVLELAKSLKVDGIACTSDLACPTVALVGNRLDLPSHPYESVSILCNKSKFRQFLVDNNFKTPKVRSFFRDELETAQILDFTFPVLVKPVDSSASRGVSLIDSPDGFRDAATAALFYSRAEQILVEEFVQADGPLITGDGFSLDGELVFRFYCNDIRDPAAPLYSVCTSAPLQHSPERIKRIDAEIQRAFRLMGLKNGTYNFDVRIGFDGEPILMEIAPRAGGGWIPQLAKFATGVDLIEATILAAVGELCRPMELLDPKGFWAAYDINSTEEGTFHHLEIDPEFQASHVRDMFLTVVPGDHVRSFTGFEGVIGQLILEFGSNQEMTEMIREIRRWVKVVVH